jgi:hypothetical protein
LKVSLGVKQLRCLMVKRAGIRPVEQIGELVRAPKKIRGIRFSAS